MKKFFAAVCLLLMSFTLVSAAQLPSISHAPLACVPMAQNAKIVAAIGNATSARVYFKAEGAQAEHYVEMLRNGAEFTAILPLPEASTTGVTYRIVARNADGQESVMKPVTVGVSANCALPQLSQNDRRAAKNLVVGMTGAENAMNGFRCEGVVGKITAAGQMQPYTECNDAGAAVAAAAAAGALSANANVAIAAAAVTGVAIGVISYEGNNDIDPISDILP